MYSALPVIYDVLDGLQDDLPAVQEVLESQKFCERAELASEEKNWKLVIASYEEAQRILGGIPKARALLGIVKSFLASAYNNDEQFQDAIHTAEDALAITSGIPLLTATEGFAHKALSVARWNSGDPTGARNNLEAAKKIYNNLAPVEETRLTLAELDQIELQFDGACPPTNEDGSNAMRVWRQSVLLLAGIGILIYLFVRMFS
jgi:tetratricopeptide (TPR) repeat protein